MPRRCTWLLPSMHMADPAGDLATTLLVTGFGAAVEGTSPGTGKGEQCEAAPWRKTHPPLVPASASAGMDVVAPRIQPLFRLRIAFHYRIQRLAVPFDELNEFDLRIDALSQKD